MLSNKIVRNAYTSSWCETCFSNLPLSDSLTLVFFSSLLSLYTSLYNFFLSKQSIKRRIGVETERKKTIKYKEIVYIFQMSYIAVSVFSKRHNITHTLVAFDVDWTTINVHCVQQKKFWNLLIYWNAYKKSQGIRADKLLVFSSQYVNVIVISKLKIKMQ